MGCNLYETEDTTDPIVNLTIAGGNEISRGVKLYLDIEDDSKIDSVSIMIDDTTAITVESDFDTIRFDITPFADESEHILYAVVEDSEGNIGESEKLNVVITEFPGWRIYEDTPVHFWVFAIDDNGLIWSSMAYDVRIFDPIQHTYRILNSDNSPLNGEFIQNIKVIEGSRVWILTDYSLFEYHYELDKWLKEIQLPPTDYWYTGLAIDNDFNVWIGSFWGNLDNVLLKYDHVNITSYKYSKVGEISDIEIHPNGTIYLSGEPGVDAFKDGKIYSFDDYPYPKRDGIQIVIDSLGNVWSNSVQDGAAFRYNGQRWENVYINSDIVNYDPFILPFFTSTDGVLYCSASDYDHIEQNLDFGIVTYDGAEWTIWNKYDNPFSNKYVEELYLSNESIAEAPSGDIWMVAGGILMRYRPSLGGYP